MGSIPTLFKRSRALRMAHHRVRFWGGWLPTVRSYRPKPYTVGKDWCRKCARCHRVRFWDGRVPTVYSRRRRVRFWDGRVPTVYSRRRRVQLWDGTLPTVRGYRPAPYTVGRDWCRKCARCQARAHGLTERRGTIRKGYDERGLRYPSTHEYLPRKASWPVSASRLSSASVKPSLRASSIT